MLVDFLISKNFCIALKRLKTPLKNNLNPDFYIPYFTTDLKRIWSFIMLQLVMEIKNGPQTEV